MSSLLRNKFKTDLLYEGDQIMTYYRRGSLWGFAMRIIVLLDDEDVLINVSRFNQIGIKSPFHGVSSNKLSRSLIEDFEKLETGALMD
ncbi:hypothetical protein [Chryseolinea soli]|nr:hypothetical protein [Chryseolinea soli]